VKKLLLVDDEPAIKRALCPVLRADGWDVLEAESAAEALERSQREVIDVVLLDLGLPDADGKDIIPAIRNNEPVAVIVLSARHQEAEKVAALDAGADDYVDKPFLINELRARIRAAERRLKEQLGSPQVLQVGGLVLNVECRDVSLDGMEIKLSPKEFSLLCELMMHAGQVVTHRRLLVAGWGNPTIDQQYLRGYVAMLRQKLEADPSEPRLIISEPGVGYRFAI
jgi:two-component system KDP operon response regulator KdpE